MKIWLVKIGENLPIDNQGKERLSRIGMLAATLADNGHDVTWWDSTFCHTRKQRRFNKDTNIEIVPNYRLNLLHGIAYYGNVSVHRIINHWQIKNAFSKRAIREDKPDIIISCLPVPGLCKAAIDYALPRKIPVLLDVRDLWPDIFWSVIPRPLHALGNLILYPLTKTVKGICNQATGIMGISKEYLEWGLAYAGRPSTSFDAVFPLGYSSYLFDNNELEKEKRALSEIGVDESKIICSFIGSFGTSCDLDPVIEVARRLKKNGVDNVQFVFGGDGDKADTWKLRAKGLDNVVFTGWVAHATIIALMQMSSIGLAAYKAGAIMGLPNKIYEYISQGLPIVSSLQGETKDFLDWHGCGVTYDPHDVSNLFSILTSLLDDPDKRMAMAENGRLVFHNELTAEKINDEMILYFEKVIARYNSISFTGNGIK